MSERTSHFSKIKTFYMNRLETTKLFTSTGKHRAVHLKASGRLERKYFSCNLFEVTLFGNKPQKKKTVHPSREKKHPKRRGNPSVFKKKVYLGCTERSRWDNLTTVPALRQTFQERHLASPRAWVSLSCRERSQRALRCDSVCQVLMVDSFSVPLN